MRVIKKQHGASMLGWLAIVMMVVVLGTAALKLAPVYMEYYSITSILEDMQKDKKMAGGGKAIIASTFNKRLNINSIYSVGKNEYKIVKVEGKKAYKVVLKYEVRKALMGNLSIVASFDRSFEISG